jgi:hypothetical protein
MYSLFAPGKRGSDDLFDQLDTSKLNAHLKELMPGLTAKVFRTYNASITLDEMVRYHMDLRVSRVCIFAFDMKASRVLAKALMQGTRTLHFIV